MPDLPPWRWALGAFCAFMIGVAKTGAPGVGTMIAPLIVMTVGDARYAAAWAVPMLSTADIFAVTYWRRHTEAVKLFSLVPWVLAGMVGGAIALTWSEPVLRRTIGGIVVAMVVIYIWRKARPTEVSGSSAFYGIATGFATTVANAAGPVMNMYLMSQRLPKEQFVATGAWFFLFVNFAKMPIYWWYNLFSRQSLLFDLCMVPAVLTGAMTGLWLLRRIPQRLFETLVIALTAISALFLFSMTILLEFCQWMEATPVGVGVRESIWWFPILGVTHLLAMAVAAGTISFVDLRLLGFGIKGAPVSQLARNLLPWTWASFAVLTVTGTLLIFAEATMLYENVAFRLKVILLVLAGLNVLVFHMTIYKSVAVWDLAPVTPLRARIAGAISLTCWIGLVAAGRAIPYLE